MGSGGAMAVGLSVLGGGNTAPRLVSEHSEDVLPVMGVVP